VSQPFYVPSLGAHQPRRATPLTRWFGRTILKLYGWRIEGEVPDLAKYMLVLAPHTSNWDFVFSISAMLAIGLEAHWFAKQEIFIWPFRKLLKALGGIAVNRGAAHGMINEVVKDINRREKFVLTITPEGTRSKVEQWKPGFYWIAEKAQLPMQLGWWDYQRKVFGLGPMVYPTGGRKADIPKIQAFYQQDWAKYPDEF